MGTTILQHKVCRKIEQSNETLTVCYCRPNERDSHPFLEDGMGVQDSSHSHLDSMCGDGQGKPHDTLLHSLHLLIIG